MKLDDYPGTAIDTMLTHRYGGLEQELAARPLTPVSSSSKQYATKPVKPGATAAMLEQRYNF